MPLEATVASNQLLLVWGDESIDKFLPLYFPEINPAVFNDEALAARIFVRTNVARFIHFKDPDNPSKGKVLLLTGPGGIYPTLFSRSDVCSKPIPNFLHVLDYLISFLWQESAREVM